MEVLAIQVAIACVIFTFCLFGKGTIPVTLSVIFTLSLVFMPWLMVLQLAVIFFSACFGSIIHGVFTGTLNENPFKEPETPKDPALRYLSQAELGQRAASAGDLKKAREHFLKAIDSGDKAKYYDLAIVEERLSGKFSYPAANYYEYAIKMGESNAHYHVALHAMNFGNYGKAKYHFHQAISKNDPRGNIGLGLLELNRRNYRDARDYFEEAVKAGITEAFIHLATIEDATGNLNDAELYYRKAIEFGNTEAHKFLGVIYFRQCLDTEARSSFMQAIALRDPEAHYYMGVFEFKLGNLSEAKKHFLQAMSTRMVDATYHMAYIHYECGEPKTAIEYLDKFSHFNDYRFDKLRKKIEQLMKRAS